MLQEGAAPLADETATVPRVSPEEIKGKIAIKSVFIVDSRGVSCNFKCSYCFKIGIIKKQIILICNYILHILHCFSLLFKLSYLLISLILSINTFVYSMCLYNMIRHQNMQLGMYQEQLTFLLELKVE